MRRILFVLAVLACALPATAGAEGGASFTLLPPGAARLGYFVFAAGAGGTRHGTVVVTNTGSAAGSVRLSTADATTAPTTGTSYRTAAAPTAAGAWISLDVRSIALAPTRKARVTFTVSVPRRTPPGQYVGGIVAATSRAAGRESVRDLSIVAVQVNVPGATVHRFAVGPPAFSSGRSTQELRFAVANQGNVIERPSGTVAVESSAGRAVETVPFQMGTFLPHTDVRYAVPLRSALGAGAYRATVALRFAGGTRSASARGTFRVVSGPAKPAATTVPAPTSPAERGTTPPPFAMPPSSGAFPWLWVGVGLGVALFVALAVLVLLFREGPTTVVTITTTPAPPPNPVRAEPEGPGAEPEPVGACAHYWQVRYDEPVLGDDGVWRFPHRCRDCGLEVLARDVRDATASAV